MNAPTTDETKDLKEALEREMTMPELPELFIDPFGMQIAKVQSPDPDEGTITLVKIFTPGMIYTLKLNEAKADALATGITGGIKLASAADLAGLTKQ